MNERYLEELNEVQRSAVLHTEGPLMIIAGAGSGKTRVLTYRVAHLMKMGVDPFHILALTFTNKAARAMKDRIRLIAGDDARNLWMGTFHSVFSKILRIESEKLGYPSHFTIYDMDDAKSLMKDIVREQGLDDKIYKPDLVLNRISSAKNNLYSWKDYQDNIDFVNDDTMSGKPKIGLLFELYAKRCFKASGMDFDDLLYNMYVLFTRFPDVLYKYQHKFKYLLVDEFQDTNYAQYVIVKKLAALNENICVVGDDAQSIYAFRGANIQNILSFEKDYPDLKVFKLEQNYRSTKNIVHSANSVIINNKHQLKKDVWTENDHGEKIKLLRAISDNEEGNLVAQSIFENKVNHQLRNSDFAILYRTNAQSRSMEEALRRMNIPYRIYGGLSFYKRKEIKDLLAYIRLVINHYDEEAFKRIINVPARGLGKTTVEKLTVLAANREASIWTVMEDAQLMSAEFNLGVRTKLSEFATMIKSFAVKLKTTNAFDLANSIAMSSGLLKDLYDDKTPEGLSRYENVQELLNGIKEFSENGSTISPRTDLEITEDDPLQRTLDAFMQDIALLTDADSKDDGDNDKVSMMTIHSAKGLEFSVVHVVGLEENLFPSQLSVSSREDLEEERRLFYVAITRAEKLLTISYAETRYRWGNLIACDPSRFLEELDPETVNEISPRRLPDKNETFENDFENSWAFGKQNKRKEVYKREYKTNGAKAPTATAPSHLKKINSAEVKNFEGDDTTGIQVGMEVEHQRFGSGKVVHVEGTTADRKATIFFEGTGNKQLLLKFAKLKILK